MNEKLYAQIDENGICFCVGTPPTDIEVDGYQYIGMKYLPSIRKWEEVPSLPTPTEPSNSEIAQMISDLYADLLISGVIV